ncbi:hypothetical protein EGI24_01260 [Lacihabitans sp. CS3-21]|nr:hypothetical protein [Lacihabitans sp. CS3-21]
MSTSAFFCAKFLNDSFLGQNEKKLEFFIKIIFGDVQPPHLNIKHSKISFFKPLSQEAKPPI